jgi:hypothetical protein
MRGNLAKKDVPGWINGRGAESSVNLITLGVRQVIRPKVTVEPDRVAASHIVQHSHRELKPTWELSASDERYKILPGGQWEDLAHKPGRSPDHPANGGFGLTPHTAHMHADAKGRAAAY